MMTFLKVKIAAAALSAAAVIQVLQIMILPTWLDIVTNGLILGLIWIVGKVSGLAAYEKAMRS